MCHESSENGYTQKKPPPKQNQVNGYVCGDNSQKSLLVFRDIHFGFLHTGQKIVMHTMHGEGHLFLPTIICNNSVQFGVSLFTQRYAVFPTGNSLAFNERLGI